MKPSRNRGGRPDRPANRRHTDLGHVYRAEQIKPTYIRGAGKEKSTINHGSSTASVCSTPPQHEIAGDYDAVYDDFGREVTEVVKSDKSLTTRLGLRWRQPVVETEDRQWKQFDDRTGRYIDGSDPHATFIGPTTLLLRGNPFPAGHPANLKGEGPLADIGRAEGIRRIDQDAVDRPEPRLPLKAILANRRSSR